MFTETGSISFCSSVSFDIFTDCFGSIRRIVPTFEAILEYLCQPQLRSALAKKRPSMSKLFHPFVFVQVPAVK